MSRKLGVCWFFLWITVAANVAADYDLSSTQMTWHNAQRRTNFATPEIQVNNSMTVLDVAVDLQNKEAWVGYYLKETAFAYIGCGYVDKAKPKVHLPMWRNSPGLCYSMCEISHHNFIGLNKGKCFCMSEKPSTNISLPTCNVSDYFDWIAGGGDDYISIYEIMKKDITINDKTVNVTNSGKCLTFQDQHGFWWDNCQNGLGYRALCKTDASGNATFYDFGYIGWQNYVQTCLKNKSLPISHNDVMNLRIPLASGQTWTNVIRSDVIYKYYETSNYSISQENFTLYGYITNKNGMIEVSFRRDDRSLFFLQSHTTNGITSSSTESLPKSSTIPKSPVSNTTSTYSMNNGFVNSTEVQQSKSKTSSDVSIPVSVSIVAFITVAVIVIVITLKRRGKFQGICTKHSASDNTSERKSETILAEKNVYVESPISDYEQISELQDNNNVDVKPDLDVENGNYGHTYFVLEPCSRESHTDSDMSDSRKEETEMNDDYNTLHSNKTLGAKADDTYDTTEKAAIKLKALRNTGCEKEFPGKSNENKEDTYNHVNRNVLKNNKTDNIYGVTDYQENDYGDVNNGCEKNRHNGDDTYSHLNTTH